MDCLLVRLPLPPPPRPPRSLEAVCHKAVNHWIQAAVQTAQGNCDVIGEYMFHPLPQSISSHFQAKVDQHLSDVKRCEAESEDHQDGGQQPDGTSPPRPALLGHQALAGREKTGDTQGEAHHSQQRQEELQDGEVEESWEEHTGGGEL